MDLTPTEIRHRPYEGETDFWLIRKFLVDTYPISPLGLNWEVRRWDGVMFYRRAPGIPEDIGGQPRQGIPLLLVDAQEHRISF